MVFSTHIRKFIMLNKLTNYYLNAKSNPISFLKRLGMALLKAQIGWTIAYYFSVKSFGTAYCAPSWMRLFQDEKPPTMLDALQHTDITIGKILFLSIAGYALFKGVEYGISAGYELCKGLWEGFTGKQSSLTIDQKIDYLYTNMNILKQAHIDLDAKLQNVYTTLNAIDQNHVEHGFNGIFDELAAIKNGGESLNRVLNSIDRNLETLTQNNPVDFTAQELNRVAQQLEQLRLALLNANNSLNPALDSVLSRVESFAVNLEERSREELAGISAELRTNMGHLRHIVEQNATTLNNPILNEEIVISNAMVQATNRNTGASVPSDSESSTIRHGARRMGTSDSPPVEPTRMETTHMDTPLTTITSNSNSLVVNGLEPGTYTLEVLSNGGIHIDPMVQQNITAVANAATNPNSVSQNLLSGIAGVALNPDVRNAVISYGARFFSPQQQAPMYMPPMPYYPPMVPYGQIPGQSSVDVSDLLARKGGEVAEGAIKVIGKTSGAFIRGFLGLL